MRNTPTQPCDTPSATRGLSRRRRLGSGRGDRGDATIVFCLGIAILLLPLGGISVDLWHAISAERALQAAATDAAQAGASAVSATVYRDSGQVTLNAQAATVLAEENLAQQSGLPTLSGPPVITINPTSTTITVQLAGQVHLSLLALLEGNKALHIAASATSAPRPSGS